MSIEHWPNYGSQTVMRPLVSNIPDKPPGAEWTECPYCGSPCWQLQAEWDLAFLDWTAACSACALRRGSRQRLMDRERFLRGEGFRYERWWGEVWGGAFVFLDRHDLRFHTQEVAIAYDRENFVLYKHGIPEHVERWLLETRGKFTEGGIADLALPLAMVSSNTWNPEDLTRCITNTGYLAVLLPRLGLEERRKDV